MSDRLFIVGTGRLGLALGEALHRAGGVDDLVYAGRDAQPPAHPLFFEGAARYVEGLERPYEGTTAVLLAVPDDAIRDVAGTLAGKGPAPPGCAALHLSGAHAVDELGALHGAGYAVGSMHPLQTVAEATAGAARLPGSLFAIAGEPPALTVARRLARALGSPTVGIPRRSRPLYHAAAVLASNYLVALLRAGVRLMVEAGVPEEDALPGLLSLSEGTLANVREFGPAEALTGPVERGDVETVRLHLRALPERERTLYTAIGREVARIARRARPDDERLEALVRILDEEGRES